MPNAAADAPPRPPSAPPTPASLSAPPRVDAAAALFAATWLAGAAWILVYLRRGWVPHDEGTLAQSAQRVLAGQLPHRDFTEVYTGGLSYLNAAAFRLFGPTLLAPRLVLFAFALLWIPALYVVARRFVRPAGAAAATLLAVAWSVPNYTAAMPSWYTLFFATFGLAALLRAVESGDGRWRWLVAAGACGGVSILFKISGLFFVAGALLALVHAEQSRAQARAPADGRRAGGGAWAYRGLVAVGAAGLAAAVWRLVTPGGERMVLHLAVPVAAVAGALVWNEARTPARPFVTRFRRLLALVLPFAAGVAAPLLLFALPFAAAGALPALLRGVFVLPRLRTAFASTPPPAFGYVLKPAVLPALLLALPPARQRPLVVAAVAAGALALVAMGHDFEVYGPVFASARAVVPLAAVCGAVALTLAGGEKPERRTAVFAAVSVAALGALVQFPFAAPIYFCYAAPLGIVAVAAVLSLRREGPGRIAAVLAVAYTLFAAAWVNRGFIYAMGLSFQPSTYAVPLPLARGGGIRVRPDQAAGYAALVRGLRAHARGRYVYAGPDAPEVYFLAGYQNPTGDLFEFFDDPATHDRRLLAALASHGVTAVALNQDPEFSRQSDGLKRALQARYPHSERAGAFLLAWREPGDPAAP